MRWFWTLCLKGIYCLNCLESWFGKVFGLWEKKFLSPKMWKNNVEIGKRKLMFNLVIWLLGMKCFHTLIRKFAIDCWNFYFHLILDCHNLVCKKKKINVCWLNCSLRILFNCNLISIWLLNSNTTFFLFYYFAWIRNKRENGAWKINVITASLKRHCKKLER